MAHKSEVVRFVDEESNDNLLIYSKCCMANKTI